MHNAHTLPDDTPYEPSDAEWRLLDRLDRSPTDREALSAVHVLTRVPFARISGAMDRFGIDFEGLLDTPWSSGERVLVGAAAVLWTGDEGVRLADIVRSLDDANLIVVLEGIALRRGWWNAVPDASATVGARR